MGKRGSRLRRNNPLCLIGNFVAIEFFHSKLSWQQIRKIRNRIGQDRHRRGVFGQF